MLTRRSFSGLVSFGAVALAGLAPGVSLASNPTSTRLHGLSPFGELKYPPNWQRFDWVRGDAPKGGTFSYTPPYWYWNQNVQTFDTLNTFVLRGSGPPRMEHCFDALMTAAVDTPGDLYCMLAQWVEISEDRNSYTFGIRPEARFHDGSRVTAADVAFSYMLLKEEGHPTISLELRNLESAEAVDELTVRLVYDGTQSDRAILTSALFPVLSKRDVESRESFDSTAMTPLLGSGPYKVGRFNTGTYIEYERDPDHWANGMPWTVGLNNFDTIRVEFFRDRTASFEAFKKGALRYREEFTSKRWATEYDFPAVKEGKVVTKLFDAELRPSMQAWAPNQRRAKFADALTRQAINHAFDFEWTNASFFYQAYVRSQSLFEKSPFKAEGLPSEAELKLLEPLRDKLPEGVFQLPELMPVSNGSGRDRTMLRRAQDLFAKAGWSRLDGVLTRDGEPLTIEFLIRSPVFERILGKFTENLKLLGAVPSIRLVDPAQYQRRIDEYDYDIAGMALSFGATPTTQSLESMFSSDSADRPGTRNMPGLKSEALDTLLKEVDRATSREELEVAMRAVDRVIRATHAWIPQWYSANHRVAYWDVFGYPEPKPDYFFPVERYWHIDADKEATLFG